MQQGQRLESFPLVSGILAKVFQTSVDKSFLDHIILTTIFNIRLQ